MLASHSYAARDSSWRPPRSRAMAASTMFQGSVCPPGVHGMLPSGSWMVAMASTVSSNSAALTIPSTWGSRCSRVIRSSDLLRVEHQALAQHGVERPVEVRDPPRLTLDLVHEELVVLPHRPRAGVVEAERALQPPVRRVQRVRVVRTTKPQSRRLELLLEL